MRLLVAALTLSFVLAAVPSTFAAKSKAPRQSHAQKMKTKKNKAAARANKQRRRNASRQRVN